MRTTPLLLALLLAPAPAYADAASQLADDLEPVLSWLGPLRESPAERMYAGAIGGGKTCHQAIATARQAGLGDGDRIFADWFRYQLPDDVHYDSARSAYLELAQLEDLCDEWALLEKMIPAAFAQQETLELMDIYGAQDPKDLAADLGKQFVKKGEECIAATDAAIQAGAPANRATKIGAQQISLATGRDQICEAMKAFGAKLGATIQDAKAAEYERVAEKYRKVGIKGAKLEVFVENDNIIWLTKGCEKLFDLKKLAKAKKLYQWWEGADGTQTIRTYTFKGNQVKSVKDKVYDTVAKASRGCK